MNDRNKKISKRLSYVLRHAPQTIDLELEENGWVQVDLLLRQFAKNGVKVDREKLNEVVGTNDKQRFEFSEDGSRIRARQGHSVEVDLGYEAKEPPEFLWHGTAERNLKSISVNGLHKASRHHIHMSENRELMLEVGRRHGKATLVKIDALNMHKAGHEFFLTDNAVWLTDVVPVEFLTLPEDFSESAS